TSLRAAQPEPRPAWPSTAGGPEGASHTGKHLSPPAVGAGGGPVDLDPRSALLSPNWRPDSKSPESVAPPQRAPPIPAPTYTAAASPAPPVSAPVSEHARPDWPPPAPARSENDCWQSPEASSAAAPPGSSRSSGLALSAARPPH